MSMTYEDSLNSALPRPIPKIPTNILDQFFLKDKIAVITGASRGIGAAAAEALAEAGAHIVNIHHQAATLELINQTKSLSQRCGVEVVNRQCDISDYEKLQSTLSGIKKEFGRIDIFLANAGVSIPKPLLEQSLEEYHAQMAVNVHGVIHSAKIVGPMFKEQGFGNFIITGSISGRVVTVPLDHTVRSLAREWRGFTRVNVVAPGYIETDMCCDEASNGEARRMAVLGRLGGVKELKGAFLYLASEASSFVTGAEVTVDGGYTLP
ncbi:short chain dehydrogenase [Aspergillus venezuelensis]